MKIILTSLIIIILLLGLKIQQIMTIVDGYDLMNLDSNERSHYIGCRRVSDNHSYCKELSRQWRKELSLNIGLTDTKGSCLED
jgi:hypothetical protein